EQHVDGHGTNDTKNGVPACSRGSRIGLSSLEVPLTERRWPMEEATMNPRQSILESIGNTCLVELHQVVPANGAKLFAKLEWQNPTGSMKDRMALGLISRAEQDGRLLAGTTVIEYTGGSTGASLALVCAVKGYPIHVVSSRAFSQEKLDHMVAYGAKLTLVPYDGKGITKQLILDMIETARKLS